MRKRTKKKVKKFFWFLIFVLLAFVCVVVFVIKPGNPLKADIDLGDSKLYSNFEIRKATFVAFKEFLSYPATLNKITYDEEKSNNERYEWAKIYDSDPDDILVLYMEYTSYKDANKKGLEKNKKYKTSWVFEKDGKWWIFKSKNK